MSVDDLANTLTVKFPGAVSGNYFLLATDSVKGRTWAPIGLRVESTAISISPAEGSRFGGSIITITGENFSAEPTDQTVQFGGNDCEVISSTATELTCQIVYMANQDVAQAPISITLKNAEKATIADTDATTLSFIEPRVSVSDIQVSYD